MPDNQIPLGTPEVSGANPKNSGGSVDTGTLANTTGTTDHHPKVAGGNPKDSGGGVGDTAVQTYTTRSTGSVPSTRSTSASRTRKV